MPVLNLISNSGEASASIHHVHMHIEQQLRVKGIIVESLLLSGVPHKDFGAPLVRDFDALRRPRKHPIGYRVLRSRLRRRLEQGDYDCIIADGLLSANLLMDLQRSLSLDGKFILVVHGRVRIKKTKLPSLFKSIERGRIAGWRVIAVSSDSARHLEPQLPPELGSIDVVENCIDADELAEGLLDRDVARRALGLAPGAVVVGTIGRMSSEKDYETLVRGFAAANIPGAVLAMVGDGKERQALQALAAGLGISGQVIFSGYMAKAYRYLRAFDCFVMTSKTEGSPIALLEAMAAARPVVCSDIPPLIDALPYQYSFVFEQGNATALARQLEAMVGLTPENRDALATSLESMTRERFSPALFGEKYSALVKRQG
ncbi:glycosyltransferase [Litorivivens sp.]|uniref:glycosyltransferase n=2 Tax=Litorivivens sp. TaxID=2020868 RepID=UPI0035681D93